MGEGMITFVPPLLASIYLQDQQYLKVQIGASKSTPRIPVKTLISMVIELAECQLYSLSKHQPLKDGQWA